MRKKYNEKYRIAFYNLPDNYIKILKNYLDKSPHYSNEIFEIIKLETLEQNTDNIINLPDLLLISIREPITEEIKKYSKENIVQIVRITDKPISLITNNNFVVSLSNKVINKELCFYGQQDKIKHIEYSVGILKQLAETANTSKLLHISRKLLEQESQLENKNNLFSLLTKLNYFIDLKDEYTKKHSYNVSEYAQILGKELNLSEEEIYLLKIGGLLHDVGKIGIPDSILKKTNSLTKYEFEIMKRHTLIGDALLPTEGYDEIRKIIRSHHERMDGKGYPDGLIGNNIPYLARIISICDSFDAMTTQRTYNKQKTSTEAFEELIRSSKKRIKPNGEIDQQLDPDLVNTFIKAINKNDKLIKELNKKDIETINNRNIPKSIRK